MKTHMGWSMTTLLVMGIPVWAQSDYGTKAKQTTATSLIAAVGRPAPDFTLKDVNGKEHKLSDLKGKIVVLEWINHECPVVNRCHNAKAMKNTLAKFKDKPVVWLAVDSSYFCEEKIEGIRKWIGKQGIDYPILLDADGKVGRSFGAKTTPHMFVIDKAGVLAYAGALDDDPRGTKDTKRNYVVEAVNALLNGSTVATATTKSYGCSVKYKKK